MRQLFPRETWELDDGTRIANVHPREECKGDHCTIHNPSDHSMRDWPLSYRNDRMIFERHCPHGVGHPDPDSLYYEEQGEYPEFAGTHGCDGCCANKKFALDRVGESRRGELA